MQAFFKESSRFLIKGPSGAIEVAVDLPGELKTNITAVICHPHPLYQGTMDNKVVSMSASAFRALGMPSVRFNYRGVGKSEGSYGEGIGETEDLYALLDWLQTVRPGPIWLAGFSFGGYVAYRAAANRSEVTELLTIAPGITRFDMQGLSEPTIPWVVIQGEADEVIEPSAVYAWLDSVKAPRTLYKLPAVGHFFHGQLVTLKDLIIKHYAPKVMP